MEEKGERSIRKRCRWKLIAMETKEIEICGFNEGQFMAGTVTDWTSSRNPDSTPMPRENESIRYVP